MYGFILKFKYIFISSLSIVYLFWSYSPMPSFLFWSVIHGLCIFPILPTFIFFLVFLNNQLLAVDFPYGL